MDSNELLAQARDAMTVKRVFGEPYEKDGVTIIPVASVLGGAGAGGGTGPLNQAARPGEAAGEDAVEGGSATPNEGYGAGYGVRATPVGVYVIRDGTVEWEPAMDVNRLMMQRAILVGLGIVVGGRVLRSIVKR
jgi:uncharacterized spore protein YtfJ